MTRSSASQALLLCLLCQSGYAQDELRGALSGYVLGPVRCDEESFELQNGERREHTLTVQ